MRLKKVVPSVINPSQTYVTGRNISKNIRTLQDVIKHANSKNISAAILFIDQEKAFDKVSQFFSSKDPTIIQFQTSIYILDTNYFDRYKKSSKG